MFTYTSKTRQNAVLLIGLLLLALCNHAHAIEAFDHFTTGFPLTGKHEHVDCADCHIAGQFKGTTTECGLCHNNIIAEGKHPSHIDSSNFCDDCHTDLTWANARFEHNDITSPCQSCHNNVTATGLTPDHITTTNNCEDCHNTISFSRVTRVDHGAVLGTCSSCHDGVTASGKHPAHIQTNAECDICHKNTNNWSDVDFDHSTVTGSCSSCHDGVTATGKDAGHFVTTSECDNCHTISGWIPVTSYSHVSANYPGDHNSSVSCIDCHTANSETIAWPFSTYIPECAACHAGVFNNLNGDHHKVNTVSDNPEFENCAGSCHIDGQLESPQHRVNGNTW